MKKFIALAGAMSMVLSLAACGNSQTASTDTTTAASEASASQAASEDTQVAGGEDTEGTEGTADNSQELPKGTGVDLTIYSNSVSDGRGDWLVERAAQDGFSIQYVDAGAAEVRSRLIAEKSAPIADVVFGLDAINWQMLKNEDILTQYVPSWADEVTDGNDPDGYYHAIVRQAILLVYDSNQLSAEEAPTDWTDLWTNEEFHGRYEVSSDLSGGTPRNVLTGILARYTDPEGDLGISDEGWAEIEKYYQNGVPAESGVDLYAKIADPSSPVVIGQMWSSGVEARDEQYGTSTAYVVPEVGVPFLTEGVAIVNGTDNLEEAQRFVDWFGSAQIQGEWAQEFSTLPANENALDMANEFNQQIAQLPAQDIDWSLVAENIDAWVEKVELNYLQ